MGGRRSPVGAPWAPNSRATGAMPLRCKPGATRRQSKQMFDPDRQIAHPPAGGVIDRVRDGWRDAYHGDFPQALDAGAVELEVRLVDELHLDTADIRVYRRDVFGKIGIEETAVPSIDSLASRSAAPMPHTTPPLTWLAAVRGLIARPQSITLTARGIRRRRVVGSTRTSTKCAL